jgi:hypothetical protein
VFTDAAAAAGVLSMRIGWGAVMFDADNDGILDLYVCNALAQNRLYMNDLEFPTTDVAVALGVADPGRSYGVATADIDLDGDVDLAVSNFLDPMRLYVNHVADVPGPANRWVRVQVVGRGTNTHAVGAEVEVVAGRAQIAAVTAGGSYKCQHDLTLSFGVGASASVPTIRTRWPDGAERTLRNYPSNCTWRVYSSARLGDFDGDGRVGPSVVVVFLGCWTGPGPGFLEPGCETMDLDGDGDVDGADLLLTLKAAYMMDTVGNKVARKEIAMIKVIAPNVTLRVLDRAIQSHGGGGVCQDFFLAKAWAGTRTLRLADGPDEVHLETISKIELREQQKVRQSQKQPAHA